MDKGDFFNILDEYVFSGEKRYLLQKLAETPDRYIGIFRPTKPKAKLIQNLFQSHEIKFGDALESVLRRIICDLGYINLDREFKVKCGKTLSMDQFFSDGEKYYLIEQKVRDDHDSTKKKGQATNFQEKIDCLYEKYGGNLYGIVYFMDPTIRKNINYYREEIKKINEKYGENYYLFYGEELFEYFHWDNTWNNLTSWLVEWRSKTKDFPEIDFDSTINISFEEIKEIPIPVWKKILETQGLWSDGIIQVIFSKGATLKLLFGYFSQQQSIEYQEIASILLKRLNEYYY